MQNHFTGIYNNGGMNGFGATPSPTGFGAQPTMNQQGQGFYPNWFVQFTGRQPAQIEQVITMVFNNYVNLLYRNNIAQGAFGDLQTSGEAPVLLEKIRNYTFVLMVNKSNPFSSQPTDVIVQLVTEVVMLGEIVRRAGGPNAPIVQALATGFNNQIMDRFATYAEFESKPNIYMLARQNAEAQIQQIIAQQQQQQQQQANPWGMNVGGGFGGNIHPSASAAVPSANLSAFTNQGAFAGGGFAFQNSQANTNDTISQIGRVAGNGSKSVYAIALEQQRNARAQEQLNVQAQTIAAIPSAPTQSTIPLNIPADNVKGVTDAFSLAAKIRKEGLSQVYNDAPIADQQPEPAQQAAVEEETPEEPIYKVKSVIPSGWPNKNVEPLVDPEPSATIPPTTGLPSIGYYGMSAGETTKMEDFQTPATTEQHTQYGAKATHSFEEDGGIMDDDFLNAIEQQEEADLQTYHERERGLNPINPTSTMDELVKQGQEQGLSTNIEDQELRIDFNNLDAKSRANICKQYHIRIVPAYVMGRDRVVQIMKGKVRTIVVERVDMNYQEHETETTSVPVFATWDAAARSLDSARAVMSDAASKPVWSSEVLLEKLQAKLDETEDQADSDVILGELIAERSIIQIDGALTCTSPQGDYQGEVVTALMERGVEEAGTVLDNAIVEYERFETGYLTIQNENEELIQSINDATNLLELVGALNNFRKESTLPVREISRLHHSFTKYLNQYLKSEFSNGWGTTDPIEDQDELTRELLLAYRDELSPIEVMNKLTTIYTTAARKAYRLEESNAGTLTVGNLHKVVLLPIYYSQYPIATLDDVGAIQSADHPELYELLNKVYSEGKDIKIVTLDNYALTFVRSLGDEDLFYLVEVTN